MAKQVTIKDIARELNTNYSTVSRALNNNPRISEETRTAIISKAREMGYKPNKLAQQLKTGHSNTIGLIVPRINRVFFSNVIHGIEIIAKQQGYNVLICQSYESFEEEKRNIQTLLSNNVAGIIMSVTRETKDISEFDKIIENDVPFVLFDRTLENTQFNEVVNDNFYGAYQATKHLIQQGYKQIIHFAGPLHLKNYNERLLGYKEALKDSGMAFNPDLVMADVLTREKGQETIKELINNNIAFDAVFSASDFSALGAMLYLNEIKKDIALIGFANEPFTELIGLTTVEQYSKSIGENSAKLLFNQFNKKEKSLDVVKIKPELIIRQSTNKKL
ncbi:LacI family DNA-binding transcriptional regulator [Pseudopedobacter beijingensis]|uniref:LacI family DNA-binding transcriptional regulator n=1 Tax=Pseudopedobacter beijingensis TaxID=1207056 RepID=A0ABW4IF84_9SPHI